MSDFKDFFIDKFDEYETIEQSIFMGGKERVFKFKPISAAQGDQLRKDTSKTYFKHNVKVTEPNQEAFVNKLIIASTVHPDFNNTELQLNWNVKGAENLLGAFKTKMIDGEYAELQQAVLKINKYTINQDINEQIEEIKN